MMTRMLGKRALRALVVTNTLAIVLTGLPPVAFAQYQTAPIPGQQSGAGPVINAGMPGDLGGFDQPWPRQVQMNGQPLTVYQPQVEAWNGNVLELKAAVGLNVEAQNQADQHFGQVFITARSDVDKERGAVWLSDVQVTRVLLPTAPQRAGEIEQALESQGGVVAKVIALDQLQSSLAIAKAQRSADLQIDVLNDAPQIILSQENSVLVVMDGEPVLREVAPNLQRVVNTNVLLLREASSGRYFLRVAGYWATTPDLNSPWTIAYESQPTFDQIKQQALNEGGVDMLDDDDRPGPYATLPAIYIADRPTELLQTDGAPQFAPIDGTRLLYVQNTASDIFLDTTTQDHYVLISGRWFRARGFEGPWTYVDGQNLPADFRRIPEAHPKGVVLVSIPGTPQAQEAAIANTIPQTATIDRQSASFDPYYDGQPQFAPVEGTSMQYAQNAPVPIIRIDPNSYYAVENGVWFTAPAPTGPWLVATVVPPVIYTIPPSSPVYYATYVRVYRATPRYVYVGYTPGYFGTYVSRRGTVVYGSGYRYKPWVGQTYYARPATYGAGVGFAAGSFIGFAAGLATAAIVGEQFWGPHYDGRRDRRDERRDNRGWDGRRNDWGSGRTTVRAPDNSNRSNIRASAGRDVVVNYQTNVYNTWNNKTVVRTTNNQPASAPATLRERQRRVDELRQSGQQNRERSADRRANPPPAATAPAAVAPQAAPQRTAPQQAAPQQAQPNRAQDNRGRFGQAPGQDRDDRERNRDNRQRPAQPQQVQPAPPTPPAAAAPTNAARDQAERQRREAEQRQRAEQDRANRDRAARENAARAQSDQNRRAQEEATRAQRQRADQDRAARENAQRQADQQRRQRDEAARNQAEQNRRAQESAARQQQEQARQQNEQNRRAQENAARQQAEQARRQQSAPPQAAPPSQPQPQPQVQGGGGPRQQQGGGGGGGRGGGRDRDRDRKND